MLRIGPSIPIGVRRTGLGLTAAFIILTTAALASATVYSAPWANPQSSNSGYKACSGSNTFTDFSPDTSNGVFTGYDEAKSTASAGCTSNTAEKNIFGNLTPSSAFTAGSSTCTSCTVSYNFTFMDVEYAGCSGGGGNATATVWSTFTWHDNSANVQGPTYEAQIWSVPISCPSGGNTLEVYNCLYWDQSVLVSFTSGHQYTITVGLYARAYTNPAYDYQATAYIDLQSSDSNCRFGTSNFAELNSISIT